MSTQATVLPNARKGAGVSLPAAPELPPPSGSAINIPPVEPVPAPAASRQATDFAKLKIPQVSTTLESGAVIPSKTDMASMSLESLNEILLKGQEAVIKRAAALRNEIPSLGFSGAAGQNFDRMVADNSGPGGGVWAAGVRKS